MRPILTPYYTLKESDVGRSLLFIFGRAWLASSFIGHVLPMDVGKRVYQVGCILQVENNEQKAARACTSPQGSAQDSIERDRQVTESHSEFLTRMLRDLSMIRHDVARRNQTVDSPLLKSIVAQLDTVMCGVEVVKEYYEERGK